MKARKLMELSKEFVKNSKDWTYSDLEFYATEIINQARNLCKIK